MPAKKLAVPKKNILDKKVTPTATRITRSGTRNLVESTKENVAVVETKQQPHPIIEKQEAVPKKATKRTEKTKDNKAPLVETNNANTPVDEPVEKKVKMVKPLKDEPVETKVNVVKSLKDKPVAKVNVVKPLKDEQVEAKIVKPLKKTVPAKSVADSSSSSVAVVVVSIEHCKSCHRFGLKAHEMFKEICEMMSTGGSKVSLELMLNEQPSPRRGSFEVSIYLKDSSDKKKEIWTGLKKGPPRKNKYPETSKVVEEILEFAKQLE